VGAITDVVAGGPVLTTTGEGVHGVTVPIVCTVVDVDGVVDVVVDSVGAGVVAGEVLVVDGLTGGAVSSFNTVRKSTDPLVSPLFVLTARRTAGSVYTGRAALLSVGMT
jgi:hypothetical protein